METWKPVVGFEGLYDVSDRGHVRSLRRMTPAGWRGGRLLKTPPMKRGYLQCSLSKGGVTTKCYVHILVLTAFAEPCPPGKEACHGPGGLQDNRWPENLRWDTHPNNNRDMIRDGTHYEANKPACDNGHLYTKANTRVDAKGHRHCRACDRANSAAYKLRQKAA